MNYYHRYCGDYIKKTLDLEMIEDGAYTRLLDWLYANERPIPHEKRFHLTRCQTPAERRAVDKVLAQYFIRDGDFWTHERAAEDIQEARPRIEAAQTNGKKGGRPKGSKNKPKPDETGTQEKPGGLFPDNPTETQGESSPYPIPHTKERAGSISTVVASDEAAAPALPQAAAVAPTLAGAICKAIKAEGIPDVAPDHADLLALIAAGATQGEFVDAAKHARKQGKPSFAYVLGTVKGRRRDAAATAASVHHGPMPEPQETARERQTREQIHEAAGVYAHRIAKPAPRARDALTIDEDEVIHVRPALSDDR